MAIYIGNTRKDEKDCIQAEGVSSGYNNRKSKLYW